MTIYWRAWYQCYFFRMGKESSDMYGESLMSQCSWDMSCDSSLATEQEEIT